ncbi:TonB-dependent siderophore receptor [Methylobacterium sp. WL64]|uniref:TonB-dependent receptor n=1 Tax=Methylobacterium sp. WL64 TaxID=2603894 RepID=UPI00164FA3CC|nr:TonB-dependent siderophore receptor [Methylobacterium sp. WL64]
MKKQELIAELFSAADDGVSSSFDNGSSPRAAGLTRLSQAAFGAASLAFVAAPAAGQEAMSIVMDQLDVTTSGPPTGSPYNPRQLQLQRLPTPILDTPQSITVVPQQLIQDQRDSTLVETLRNVPGITMFGGEGGTQGDNINIRGYSARNDFYRDGVRDPGWYTRDTFSIESVEVLKGPSSFLFGRGSTGGVVNVTSKLPFFAADKVQIDASGYSAPGARVTGDINTVLGDSAIRLAFLANDTDVAGRDHINTTRFGVAPSLRANLTPDDQVTVSYIYQKDNNIPDYGIPVLPGGYFGTYYGRPAPVSKNTYFGRLSPGFSDTEQVDAHIGTLQYKHTFDQDWSITNTTRYSLIDRFVRVRGVQVNGTNLYGQATGGAALSSAALFARPLGSLYVNNTNDFQNHTVNTLFTNQTDLVGHIDTFGLQHTLLSGIELSQETRDQYRTNIAGGSRVNVGFPNPYPTSPGVVPTSSTDTYDVGNTVGVYASDQVKINRYLEILGGLRYDDLSVHQHAATVRTPSYIETGPLNATTPYNVVNKVQFVSWRTGAVVHPVDNASVYFMYGTSFDPSSEYLTITGGQQNLKPTTNETYEAGAKYDLFDSQLSLTGAVFQVTQQNAIEAVDSTNGIYSTVGTTRVQGFELGVAGKITDAWSVFGGYTYLDGRVLKSAQNTTGAFVSTPGNILANTPHNTFALTSTYLILPGLTVGGSAYYVGERFTSSANTALVPGYWRFDALATYRLTENAALQLNVYNIADTKNFESVSGYGSATPGPGRTFVLTARLTF